MNTKLARPYVLTEPVQKRIIEALEGGNFVNVACEAAGTTYDCFRHWQRRWEEDDPVAQQFADFFTSVKAATAIGECNALQEIRAGSPGWQGSAWFLERRHHKRWGKKETVVVQKGDDFDPSNMTDEQLREIARGKGKRRA